MYAEIRRDMGLPYIPNAAKTLATSPAALGIFCDITRSYGRRTTLPQSLISMILYTIAKTGDCKYCSATNELSCRTLGVDEAALATLVEDLPSLTPQRVRVIIDVCPQGRPRQEEPGGRRLRSGARPGKFRGGDRGDHFDCRDWHL